jgi:hypothetical protein
MNRFLKWVLGAVIAVAAVAILIVFFLRGRREAATEAEQEHPSAAPSRVSTENGQTFITLDVEAQSRYGIETRAVAVTSERQELRANAVVLPVQNLTELRNNYLSAAAQVDKAKAALEVSQHAYERQRQLYEDNQNASAKALQEAEGTWHSDEASYRAASDALRLIGITARQGWGELISKSLADGSPGFDRILTQADFLLQVSLAADSATAPPKTASIQLPNGKIQRAEYLSAYPSVDSRIQTPSFLYVTAARPDLAPGMTLVVLLPMGSPARGVTLPSNAIVWWQGKSWAYVRTAPDQFARREASTETPVPNGWFVSTGFARGEQVVIRGAQQLLSEEFRSQIQAMGESQ